MPIPTQTNYPHKEILYLYDTDGGNYRALSTTDFQDYWVELARGNISGQEFINKFGRNQDTVTNDVIWASSTPYTNITGALLCNVVSTNTGDSGVLGGGGHRIYIKGINENFDVAEEYLNLSGTIVVSTSGKYQNIHRSYITSGNANGSGLMGNVSITSTQVGSPVIGFLLAGYNQTQSTVFQVPRNYTAYFNLPQVTVQSTTNNATIDIGIFRKDFGGVFRVQNDWLFNQGNGGYQNKVFGSPLKFPEKCIIYFKCIAASNPFDVVIDYDLTLIKNS